MRVASVPSDHVYVRHVSSSGGSDGVRRVPVDAPGPWRPSPVLEPTWLRAHAADVDLVHVHFGFEHRTAMQLRTWVEVLDELALPLVLTVHDLVNPHLLDQTPQDEALDVLVPAAREVLTLTRGAAAEVQRRWARTATVVPHPHVVPLDRLAAARPAGGPFTVDVLASARANSGAHLVYDELVRAAADLPGVRLLEAPVRRLGDAELWDRLSAVDVLVLPYLFGTHSGFVEACHDLGTTVVASRVGHLAEQQRVLSFDLGVPGSLTAAVQRAHALRPRWQAEPGVRAAQRVAIAARHADLYARARAA